MARRFARKRGGARRALARGKSPPPGAEGVAPLHDPRDAYRRVRNLVALDAQNVMRRLEERREEMIANFSRHRDRESLLAPLRSWVPGASFAEMVLLPPAQQTAASAFYEELDGLRWYFRYTNDMPSTAAHRLAQHWRRLGAAFVELVRVLGPPEDAPEGVAAEPLAARQALPAKTD
jgi:hypothetical protein